MANENPVSNSQPPPEPEVSGKLVVVVIFLFGFCVAGGVWGYWWHYLKPFRPVQEALFREDPQSNPRVFGGRFRGHADLEGRLTVLVVVQIPFLATEKPEQAAALVEKIRSLVAAQPALTDYELLRVQLPHATAANADDPPTFTVNIHQSPQD